MTEYVQHNRDPLADIQASFSTGKRWFCFVTSPGQEKAAGAEIRKLGYQVFTPFEKRILRRPNKKPRQYEVALFPRYGFVQFDINKDEWGAILGIDEVTDVLRTCGVPRCAEQEKIDALMLAASMGIFDKTKPLSVGMTVEITDGPATGFIGKVLRARTDDKIDIVLEIFGAKRLTTVPMTKVKEISA